MRIPSATYRLQINRALPLRQVTALLDYLDALGVSDVYLSPILMAVPGSGHGYDVVDHSRLNPDAGSEADLVELGAALRARNMGMLADIVPNHMSIAVPHNRLWIDVLENGPSSPFARFFDIDWAPPKTDLEAKVLLPVLSDQYGRVLEAKKIRVLYGDGAFSVDACGMPLPVAPRTWPQLLEPALSVLRAPAGRAEAPSAGDVDELESILFALSHLPPRTETDPTKVRERRREKEIVKRRLAALVSSSRAVAAAVARSVDEMNGVLGDPRSFDKLDALLAEQAYRLAFWRVATDEINYRRFFDINDLAAIRVEEPLVFNAVHELPLRYVSMGIITGFRIDHLDGLFSPSRYLHDLKRACRAAAKGGAEAKKEGTGDSSAKGDDFYIIAEKILETDEALREGFPIQGTTGYGFLNMLGSVFVDPMSARKLLEIYASFTGSWSPFADVAYESKKLILEVSLSSELTVLARKLDRISEQHRESLDFTLKSLEKALIEIIACFPVYRTYIDADQPSAMVHPDDERHIQLSVREAKRRNPAVSESIYDFIKAILLLEDPHGIEESDREARQDFVLRFQQLTGPVTAKGLEDTAFYRYYPLASLNEVGGSPARLGITLADFHFLNRARVLRTPHALSTTSTHDTKRSEDVRARVSVLSEAPEQWERALLAFKQHNERHKVDVGGVLAPDANEEYLLYQTLLGSYPLEALTDEGRGVYVERIQRYMNKALKEAKVHTSWIRQDEAYDRAVRQFTEAILTPGPDNLFLKEFELFYAAMVRAGLYGALSQVLVKIAAPGVPDFYQGSELYRFQLVDPDNRDPVDFEESKRLLAALRRDAEQDAIALCRNLVATPEDPRLKLYLTNRGLEFRKARRTLFDNGAYTPLEAYGSRANHAVAFARVCEQQAAVAIAGRFFLALDAQHRPPIGAQVWQDTTLRLHGALGQGRYRDFLTGVVHDLSDTDEVRLAVLLEHLPFALLEKLG